MASKDKTAISPKGDAAPQASLPDSDGLAKLREAYGFMTEHNLDTIEIEEPGLRLRLVRRPAPAPTQVPVPVFIGGPGPAAASIGSPSLAGGSYPLPHGAPAEAMPPGTVAVKSGMMGIFYRAPSPSSPPFVKEGDTVKSGQVLCIIEAMKVFNELKAEFAGVVAKVLVENGKPVKAGQDVFWIQRG